MGYLEDIALSEEDFIGEGLLSEDMHTLYNSDGRIIAIKENDSFKMSLNPGRDEKSNAMSEESRPKGGRRRDRVDDVEHVVGRYENSSFVTRYDDVIAPRRDDEAIDASLLEEIDDLKSSRKVSKRERKRIERERRRQERRIERQMRRRQKLEERELKRQQKLAKKQRKSRTKTADGDTKKPAKSLKKPAPKPTKPTPGQHFKDAIVYDDIIISDSLLRYKRGTDYTQNDDVTAEGRVRTRRAATANRDRLWEHAVIPYEIDSNFSGIVYHLSINLVHILVAIYIFCAHF